MASLTVLVPILALVASWPLALVAATNSPNDSANTVARAPQKGPGCNEAAVGAAVEVKALRALIDRCRAVTPVALAALVKLNQVELPPAPRLREFQYRDDVTLETVTLHGIALFGIGEAYPSEEGLSLMAEMVREVNAKRGSVASVLIIGGVDPAEAATPLARDIARGRAETARKFLITAGIAANLIRLGLATPGASVKVVDASSSAAAASDKGNPEERKVEIAILVTVPR